MVVSSLHYLEIPFHRVRARLLIITPFTAMAASSTITPRIEIYTSLACSFLRPEYGESLQQPADILGFLHTNDCRIPAVALHSSCVNFSDVFMIDKSLQTNGADAPPTRKQRCASDPVVQAAVAKLTTRAYKIVFLLVLLHVHALCRQAAEEPPISSSLCWMMRLSFRCMTDPHFILVITMSMGILSCITTGWWGAVSLTISSQTI